jgi:hypothetical protein
VRDPNGTVINVTEHQDPRETRLSIRSRVPTTNANVVQALAETFAGELVQHGRRQHAASFVGGATSPCSRAHYLTSEDNEVAVAIATARFIELSRSRQ